MRARAVYQCCNCFAWFLFSTLLSFHLSCCLRDRYECSSEKHIKAKWMHVWLREACENHSLPLRLAPLLLATVVDYPFLLSILQSCFPPFPLAPQLIFQLQFLSSLRMLEANISGHFLGLLDKIKWLNLHFDAGLGIWNCKASSSMLVQNSCTTWDSNSSLPCRLPLPSYNYFLVS